MQMDIGTHPARAVQGYISETNGGTRYVAVEFSRTDQPSQMIFWSGYLGNIPGKDGLTNTQRTIRTLRMLGWEGNNLADLRTITKNEVEIVVDDEEYQGKVYRKCLFVNEPGGGVFRPKAIAADKLRMIADEIQAELERTPPASDDDIPF